jgi:hypothetical protein
VITFKFKQIERDLQKLKDEERDLNDGQVNKESSMDPYSMQKRQVDSAVKGRATRGQEKVSVPKSKLISAEPHTRGASQEELIKLHERIEDLKLVRKATVEYLFAQEFVLSYLLLL